MCVRCCRCTSQFAKGRDTVQKLFNSIAKIRKAVADKHGPGAQPVHGCVKALITFAGTSVAAVDGMSAEGGYEYLSTIYTGGAQVSQGTHRAAQHACVLAQLPGCQHAEMPQICVHRVHCGAAVHGTVAAKRSHQTPSF